jgi:hypothetical protein
MERKKTNLKIEDNRDYSSEILIGYVLPFMIGFFLLFWEGGLDARNQESEVLSLWMSIVHYVVVCVLSSDFEPVKQRFVAVTSDYFFLFFGVFFVLSSILNNVYVFAFPIGIGMIVVALVHILHYRLFKPLLEINDNFIVLEQENRKIPIQWNLIKRIEIECNKRGYGNVKIITGDESDNCVYTILSRDLSGYSNKEGIVSRERTLAFLEHYAGKKKIVLKYIDTLWDEKINEAKLHIKKSVSSYCGGYESGRTVKYSISFDENGKMTYSLNKETEVGDDFLKYEYEDILTFATEIENILYVDSSSTGYEVILHLKNKIPIEMKDEKGDKVTHYMDNINIHSKHKISFLKDSFEELISFYRCRFMIDRYVNYYMYHNIRENENKIDFWEKSL